MLNTRDQLLLEALCYGHFEEAEEYIKQGADINAYSSTDNCEPYSVLADAIFDHQFRVDLIVDFALAHGLDPKAHKGRHVLQALAYLSYADTNPYTLKAFQSLLNVGIDPTVSLSPDDEQTLVDYYDEEISPWIDNSNIEAASLCAIFRDAVKAHIAHKPSYDYTLIDRAVGKRIQRVLLWQHKKPLSSIEAQTNLVHFQNHFDQWVALDLGAQALVVLEGTQAYLMDIKRLNGATLLDMSKHFPTLIGQKIDKAFFNQGVESYYDIQTVLHLSNKQQFVVNFNGLKDIRVTLSDINTQPKWSMQKLDEALAERLTSCEFKDAKRLIQVGANINAITQWDNHNDPTNEATAIESILSIASSTDFSSSSGNLETVVDFMLANGLDPKFHHGRHILAGLASLTKIQKPDSHTLSALKKLLSLPVDWTQAISIQSRPLMTIAEYFDHEVERELSTQQGQTRAAYFALFAAIVRAKIAGEDISHYQSIVQAKNLTIQRVLLAVDSEYDASAISQTANPISFDATPPHAVILDFGDIALLIPDHRFAYVVPIAHLSNTTIIDLSDAYQAAIGTSITDVIFGTETQAQGPYMTICHLDNGQSLIYSEKKDRLSLALE